MSAFEALRALKEKGVSWLTAGEAETIQQPQPPSPLESAERLTQLARAGGLLDRTSPTWIAIAAWAANELIAARDALETATGDKAAALRSRCSTLRDLLADERTESKPVIEDPGPDTFT